MSGAHTPGPWSVDRQPDSVVWVDTEAGGRRFVPIRTGADAEGFYVALVQCDECDPEQARNAQLIAQAPALLSSLKFFLVPFSHMTDIILSAMGGNVLADAVLAARKIVAAAEGPQA